MESSGTVSLWLVCVPMLTFRRLLLFFFFPVSRHWHVHPWPPRQRGTHAIDLGGHGLSKEKQNKSYVALHTFSSSVIRLALLSRSPAPSSITSNVARRGHFRDLVLSFAGGCLYPHHRHRWFFSVRRNRKNTIYDAVCHANSSHCDSCKCGPNPAQHPRWYVNARYEGAWKVHLAIWGSASRKHNELIPKRN